LPAQRTIEMLVLEAGRWLVVDTTRARQVARIEPFDAIDFELDLLWGDAPTAGQP
jgi:hypothetical protein